MDQLLRESDSEWPIAEEGVSESPPEQNGSRRGDVAVLRLFSSCRFRSKPLASEDGARVFGS